MFNSLLNGIAKWVIIFYQKGISPYIGPRCRYHPTCSAYSYNCFQKFSFFRAMWYSVRRILKCHPLSPGGYDPVPEDHIL